MSFIVTVVGVSGAGKDTVYKAFKEVVPTLQNLKFSAPMKHMLALAYGIEPEQLEDREFRNQVIPTHPEGLTYLEVMIRCFHKFPEIDAGMMTGNISRQAKALLAANIPVCFTDTRNFSEVYTVSDLNDLGYPVYLVEVQRPGQQPKESDINLKAIIKGIDKFAEQYHVIANDYSQAQLKYTSIEVIKEIKDDLTNRPTRTSEQPFGARPSNRKAARATP